MSSIAQKSDGEIISIDGKTLRGSKDGDQKPLHMISAWANENQLVLGQMATDEKSNEITAVSELLDTLDVSGCIITADAMSTILLHRQFRCFVHSAESIVLCQAVVMVLN